jgi:hypothetical protein
MVTRNPKPDALAVLNKREVFAALIAAGVFASPAGQQILNAKDDSALHAVADFFFLMADVMVQRGAA